MIKLPIEYKEQLEARFNPDNAELREEIWEVNIPCPLCEVYNRDCYNNKADPCLLHEQGITCSRLISTYIETSIELDPKVLCWDINDDKKVRKELKRFKMKVIDKIKWIYNKKEK